MEIKIWNCQILLPLKSMRKYNNNIKIMKIYNKKIKIKGSITDYYET